MLDSTIISVSIKVFDWAKYKKEKGVIKLHTLYDYDGCMSKYLYMTEGKKADIKQANYMLMPKGSVIVADRAYIDFNMLFRWMKERITFVMKLKDAIKYDQTEEFPLQEGKDEHILKDEKIRLTGTDTKDLYPEYLRWVVVYSKTEKADVDTDLDSNDNFIAITFLRMNLFVKIFLTEWLDNPFKPPVDLSMKNRQERLF